MIKIFKKGLFGFCLFITIGLVLSVIESRIDGKFMLLAPSFMNRFGNLTNAMTVYIVYWGIMGIAVALVAYYIHKKIWGVLIKNAVLFLVAYILVVATSLVFHVIPLDELMYFSFGMIAGYLVISVPRYIWIRTNVSKINNSLK